MMFYYHDTLINYQLKGEGPALVFLHGFLESSSMWQEIAPFFEATHTLITIDLPGHGASGVIQNVHSMELMAKTVKALLEAIEIESVTLIGHSMGGYVSLAFAELYPENVASLILLNSTPEADAPARLENRKRALKIIKTNASAFISMAISNLFTSEEQKQYATSIRKLKEEALQLEVQGVTAAIKGMMQRKDRTEVLRRFDKKKTMIIGEEDPIVNHEAMMKLAIVCNATPISVEGGHMSWMSINSEIVKIMRFVV